MSTFRGKQIIDKTIIQQKLGLVNPTQDYDCATKLYVDDSISVELNTTWDKEIVGLVTAIDGDLATNQPVTIQPISGTGIDVYVNGVRIQVGDSATDWAYFSPDGTYKRVAGNERDGDMLYWNGDVADYQLDGDDSIDYVYITTEGNNRVVKLNPGDIHTYEEDVFQNLFTFYATSTQTATIILNGVSFEIYVHGPAAFRFDNGGGQEYTFNTLGETNTFTASGTDYLVIYDDQDSNGNNQFTILPV